MRFSSAAATGVLVALIAVLSGCSSTAPSLQSLPAASQAHPRNQIEFLKMQIAGKFPTLFPRAALEHALKDLSTHGRPHFDFNRHRHHYTKPGMWVSNLEYGYVIGLSDDAQHTVAALDVAANGCQDPYGIKVDHSQNLWVACAFNATMTNGVVQEYKVGNSTPAATFNDAGCNSPCTLYNASAQDVALDANGHVFAANIDSNCSPNCSSLIPVVWWPANSPNSVPTPIADPNIIFGGGFIDVDSAGNLYTTGYGCIGTQCGYLLDEISNPTTSPTVTNLIPPSFAANLEGVYTSKKGTVLSVTDGTNRTIAQYHLNPWNPTPFKTLGPTATNIEGYGQPISGGYKQDESKLVQGDVWGWVDVGDVGGNHWNAYTDPDLGILDVGAQYLPSDK
jgi:hypothetical protein